jgi:HEAT repeat protein
MEPLPNQQVAKGKDTGKKNREENPPNDKVELPSELELVDRLFADGKHEEAVQKYKAMFALGKRDKQAEMLRRIVEFEAARGDLKEARRWIEQGLDFGLAPAYSTPGATKLLAQVQADRNQRAALAKQQIEAEAAAKKSQERKTRAQKILADLRSNSATTRQEAMKAAIDLGDHGTQVAPALVAALAEKDDRQAAFLALIDIGKLAVPDLTKGLGNKNQFVRLWSAHALGRIGPDASEAVPALRERARSDTSVSVRDAAQAALAKVRK